MVTKGLNLLLLITAVLFHFSFSLDEERRDNATANGRRECPRQCTCEIAPLRSAAFVVTWMSSWGEDDLPDLHPNDILNADLMVKSLTASDARVDVEVVGLHATCSLHPTTNVTLLLQEIPKDTMVLNILQSPGCNLTIIDGGQLVGLSELKALHLQGYAHKHRQQVSGYKPNSVLEMIEHKKLVAKELNKVEGSAEMQELHFAMAEDALHPLTKLQLLDLQFVRLVASKEERRSRRYSTEPVSAINLLDLPMQDFMNFLDNADTFDLPPHLRYLLKNKIVNVNANIGNRPEQLGGSYIVKKNLFDEREGVIPGPEAIRQNLHMLDIDFDRRENMLDTLQDDTILVPYEIFREGMSPKLAPFSSLKELKYLRVAHASLDRVGPELFEGLHNLHTLTLEYNKIKILPEGLFSPTPTLRHLSIAHNSILTLESKSLKDLTKLITLDIDFNNISILGPSSFPDFPSLLTLRAIGNPIAHLLPGTFRSLNLTENMFLGSSNISIDIHQNTFRFMSNLKMLVVKNVTQQSLEMKIFAGMEKLIDLTVHGIIPEIAFDAFSNTLFLEKLNISYCSLMRLSMDSFYGLNSLTSLDMSHNKLSNIIPGTVDHLTSLRELYLHNNLLTTLPLGLFLPAPLKLVQLHENPWHCTCDLLQLSPSITNKVVKPGTVKCEWNDKLDTVCEKEKDKFVYDSRVAPLCFEPPSLKGSDVYHAALRHFECSKYHWDPSLLLRYSSIDVATVEKKSQRPKPDINRTKNKDQGPSWLPLMSFTPEPYDKDLLDIAESEGLEEVIETASAIDMGDKQPQSSNIHQNDQPYFKNGPLKLIKSHAVKYRHQKRKLKNLLKANGLRRQTAKKAYLKNKRELTLQQKLKIKSILQKRQKKLYRSVKKLEWKKNKNPTIEIDNSLVENRGSI